ncbi:MAG: ATP-dependent DNA ligase, partial [Pseudomonadota bacterium]
MRLAELVETSRRVAATRSRLEKVAQLATVIARLPPSLVATGTSYLAGELPQGRLGVGYAVLRALQSSGSAAVTPAQLDIDEVDRTFTDIKAQAGAGAALRRTNLLGGLLARATADEQAFLLRLVTGELRQGALEGIVIEAVARAFAVPPADVRRATMLAGGLPPVAEALARQGAAGLTGFALELFQPIQPMLADTADDVGDALERLGEAAFEYKLDGARVQVHKDGARVEVYSRALNRVTAAVPEIVERVAALPARRLILDGEAIVLSAGGRPLPFQVTMRRFGRKLDVAGLRNTLPLAVSFFDVLRIDDDVLLDRPLTARWEALGAATNGQDLVPRAVVSGGDAAGAGAFLARALADGHEGVVAKSLAAAYAAGRRGQDWLKLKAAHTLDLVV